MLTDPRLSWTAEADTAGPSHGLAETLNGQLFVFVRPAGRPAANAYRLHPATGVAARLWRWKRRLHAACVPDPARPGTAPVPTWRRRLYRRLPAFPAPAPARALEGRYRLTRLSDLHLGFRPADEPVGADRARA